MTYSLILRRTLLAAGAAALCLPAMAELADIKSAGKLRVEGKGYVMQDGDVCHFLFNV